MTATEFETLALQWISIIVPVGVAGATAYYKIKAYVDQLHAENAGRIDQHDALSGVVTTQSATMNQPTQGTGPVNPAPVGPLPDPQAFRQPLGQPNKQ